MEIAVLACQRVCFFQGRATRFRRLPSSQRYTKYMMYIEIYNIRNEYNITGWYNFYQPNANHTPSDPILRSHCTKSCKAFQNTAWTNRCALPPSQFLFSLTHTRTTRLQNQRWTTHHASFTVPKKPKSYLCDTSSIRVRNSLSSDTALEIAQELLSSLHQQQQAYKNGGKISKASQSCATECMMVTRGKVCPQDHVENVILRI